MGVTPSFLRKELHGHTQIYIAASVLGSENKQFGIIFLEYLLFKDCYVVNEYNYKEVYVCDNDLNRNKLIYTCFQRTMVTVTILVKDVLTEAN